MSDQRQVSTIAVAARIIADSARIAMQVGGHTVDAAIDTAVKACIQTSRDAQTRSGQFQFHSTTEQLEDALFIGAVAHDTATNTYRPSTGPVRDFIRSLLATTGQQATDDGNPSPCRS